ncbi:hypothetical protein HS7_16910 [Sulfolobales archaeon HS-7]|nr:hypothetical protein HS7_16910 [Sulfolobales archaeon HS-7]
MARNRKDSDKDDHDEVVLTPVRKRAHDKFVKLLGKYTHVIYDDNKTPTKASSMSEMLDVMTDTSQKLGTDLNVIVLSMFLLPAVKQAGLNLAPLELIMQYKDTRDDKIVKNVQNLGKNLSEILKNLECFNNCVNLTVKVLTEWMMPESTAMISSEGNEFKITLIHRRSIGTEIKQFSLTVIEGFLGGYGYAIAERQIEETSGMLRFVKNE